MVKLSAAVLLVLAVSFIAGGCVQVGGDRPLVDFAGFAGNGDCESCNDDDSSQVHDPAPGVPDSELSDSQLMQRDLADCQRDYESLQRRYRELETRYNQQRESYEDYIDNLEEQLQDLRDD
ncbi:MAG: hypothetical protein JW936_01050 [Sedimentisphaerales bacterium]|nr:hypothetical protein [Sedimentisphaerales bacterium]